MFSREPGERDVNTFNDNIYINMNITLNDESVDNMICCKKMFLVTVQLIESLA